MNSLILRVASRFLVWLMLIFSLYILLRGHNSPGGGFIGGLIAGSALALFVMAHGVEKAKKIIRIPVTGFLAVGLGCSLTSAVAAMFLGKPFFTALWVHMFGMALGTPMLFDFGVYLTVISAVLFMVFALESKPEEES